MRRVYCLHKMQPKCLKSFLAAIQCFIDTIVALFNKKSIHKTSKSARKAIRKHRETRWESRKIVVHKCHSSGQLADARPAVVHLYVNGYKFSINHSVQKKSKYHHAGILKLTRFHRRASNTEHCTDAAKVPSLLSIYHHREWPLRHTNLPKILNHSRLQIHQQAILMRKTKICLVESC